MEEEKKEFFKHKDIRTMQKDISGLREQQAEQEKQRISELNPAQDEQARQEQEPAEKQAEERKPLEEKLKETSQRQEMPSTPPPSIPPSSPSPSYPAGEKPAFPLKKPSGSEKVFVRIGIVLVLLLVFANMFLFWYWYLRETGPESPQGPPQEETPPEDVVPPEDETPPEIITPSAFFPIGAVTFLKTTSTENIAPGLSQLLETDLTKGYTRVLIQNTEKNEFLGLKELFSAFEIVAPEGFYQKLDNDFTLFVFSQEQGNRLGFAAKITEKQELIATLKSWEQNMEQSFDGLFTSLGKQEPALVSYFKEVPYNDALLRYQTFSRQDLGICYSIFNDYLVWTSSWESLLKTIDKLSE